MSQQWGKNSFIEGGVIMRAIWLALLCSILINAVLLCRIFNLGVAVTHGADEIQYREKQASDLKKLLPFLLRSTSREQILLAANQAGLEVIEKPNEGAYVGTLFFTYSGGRVMSIDFQ